MKTFERSLDAQSAPGTNLKGAVDEAHWYFLLPSLELGRVLVLGSVSPSTLATLADLGDEIAVWTKDDDQAALHAVVEKRELSNVRLLTAEQGIGLPAPSNDVDVLYVADAGLVRSYLGDGLAGEPARVLREGGSLYADFGSTFDLRSRPGAGSWVDGLENRVLLWAAPAWGEMRFTAPLVDKAAIGYLEGHFLEHALRRELLKRPRRILARSPLANRIRQRRALLAVGAEEASPSGPPRYVESIAAQAGASAKGGRWAFASPGDYSSQKALLFLFDDEQEQPRSLVKITRDSKHNGRLENEWEALKLLDEREIGHAESRPAPLFFGHHGGRAVLGETALAGVPFTQRTWAKPDCPYARSALDWLLELGVATSHRPEDPSAVVTRLKALISRFDELYHPEAGTSRFLAGQVETIGRDAHGLRLVFQHGDPGPWNILVSPAGMPGFLDWEAADPDGLPLWDLLHFLRSFAFSVSQKARRRNALKSFADHMAGDSALNMLLTETVHRFCRESGLSPSLVEPLFHLCWVHRAVKQASRLPQKRLESGRYFNLVRFSIERRDAPGLQRLFSLPAAS